jgi:hypothetical protein
MDREAAVRGSTPQSPQSIRTALAVVGAAITLWDDAIKRRREQ